MSSSHRIPLVGLLSALAVFALSLAGCGTGATVLVPVLGGRERVRVEFTNHGPAHAEADGFEVQFAGFINNTPPKTPDFGFTVSVAKNTPPPRRITVEDITEEAPVPYLTDEAPVVKDGAWRGVIAGIDAHDPRTEWLYRVNNDLRIFRFTIIADDGHKIVLDQASNYPTYIKTAIRITFGEKL